MNFCKRPAALLCCALLFCACAPRLSQSPPDMANSGALVQSEADVPRNGLADAEGPVLQELAAQADALAPACRPFLSLGRPSPEDANALRGELQRLGYTVLLAEADTVSALSNPDAMEAFAQSAASGRRAVLKAVSVTESGHIFLVFYYLEANSGLCAQAQLCLDDTGNVILQGPGETKLENWKFTQKGNFIFELALGPLHADGYSMLRAKPVEPTFQQLAQQYLAPVGYQDNNLFLCSWSGADPGEVCLNDAFDAALRLSGAQAYTPPDPAAPSLVPAQQFEAAMCRYLPFTAGQLRAGAMRDTGGEGYWYLPYDVSYWAVLPGMVPEVTEARQLSGDTLVLTVDVACIRRGTDRMFTHELTLRTLEDGKFQLIANRVLRQDDSAMPQYHSRLSGWEETVS